MRALAEQVGLEFVDLTDFQIDPSATALLPEALARRYRAMPIGDRDGQAARRHVRSRERLRARRHPHDHRPRGPACRRHGERRRAGDPEVRRAWTTRSRRWRPSLPRPDGGADDDRPGGGPRGRARSSSSSTAIMTQAVGDRASDVHIEPTGARRARPVPRGRRAPRADAARPKNIQGGLISRLKVMADLNIAERRVPQDGRISHAGRRQAASTCGSRRSRRSTARRS